MAEAKSGEIRAGRRLVAVPAAGYAGRMYAIAFDLEVAALKEHYSGNTHTNGYNDVRKFLGDRGFGHQQGSVYFGDSSVDAVSCVLTVQEMSETFPWLRHCVKDIRMLRIEENNDLAAAVNKAPVPAPGDPAQTLFEPPADATAA